MSLTPHFPDLFSSALPTIIYCSADYGQEIHPSACTNLYRVHWPEGVSPVRLYLREPAPSDALWLPYTFSEAGCTLSIEAAGPGAEHTHFVTVYPDMLANRAAAVIQRCPTESDGIGGFVTHGFMHALNEFFAPWGWGPDFSGQDVLVYGDGHGESQPGDTDPMVGGAVARMATLRWRNWSERNSGRVLMRHLMNFFRTRAIEMARGDSLRWWEGVLDHRIWSGAATGSGRNMTVGSETTTTAEVGITTTPGQEKPVTTASASHGNATNIPHNQNKDSSDPLEPGDMTYECDSSLGGAPKPVDCEKLSWAGLRPSDSVESLQAHVPKIYSQGTCALGITSASTTKITWAHLLAAFDTLYNLCVRNPISSAKGGRAYYGQQAAKSWINGKRDSVGGVNGSEALPMGINATLFKHDEKSNLSCELTLAQEGKDITMCAAD